MVTYFSDRFLTLHRSYGTKYTNDALSRDDSVFKNSHGLRWTVPGSLRPDITRENNGSIIQGAHDVRESLFLCPVTGERDAIACRIDLQRQK